MKSEHIRKIFSAFAVADRKKFIEVAQEVISDEEKKSHHLLAKDLKEILRNVSNGRTLSQDAISKRYKSGIPIPRDSEKGFPLLEIKEYHLDWNDVILTDDMKSILRQVVKETEESELLASYGLKPKQKILFCGPPGTGKTLSAQVISSVLRYPLVLVRFDSIVSSFLGETASNLRKIFNFIGQGQWVVLLDEFDVVGKHRDDPYEHGEIKRIVNNLMQMLDGYEGDSLLIAATNHHNLIDSGLWRRFDETILFDIPNPKRRKQIFDKYLRVLKKSKDLDLDSLVKSTEGFSPSDIATVCWEALKNVILNGNEQIDTDSMQVAVSRHKQRKEVEGKRNGRTL